MILCFRFIENFSHGCTNVVITSPFGKKPWAHRLILTAMALNLTLLCLLRHLVRLCSVADFTIDCYLLQFLMLTTTMLLSIHKLLITQFAILSLALRLVLKPCVSLKILLFEVLKAVYPPLRVKLLPVVELCFDVFFLSQRRI